MSQNVYVNLKSLKTSVSGDGRTAFDKLKTVFGKNSSNGDKPMQASRPAAYSSRKILKTLSQYSFEKLTE